jgi:hypothetical protein
LRDSDAIEDDAIEVDAIEDDAIEDDATRYVVSAPALERASTQT